jgi:hypothetical protein
LEGLRAVEAPRQSEAQPNVGGERHALDVELLEVKDGRIRR